MSGSEHEANPRHLPQGSPPIIEMCVTLAARRLHARCHSLCSQSSWMPNLGTLRQALYADMKHTVVTIAQKKCE